MLLRIDVNVSVCVGVTAVRSSREKKTKFVFVVSAAVALPAAVIITVVVVVVVVVLVVVLNPVLNFFQLGISSYLLEHQKFVFAASLGFPFTRSIHTHANMRVCACVCM